MSADARSPIAIACTADGRYAGALAALIRSALQRLDPPRRLSIYLLDGGLHDRDRERLVRSWAPECPDIMWIPLDSAEFEGLPLWGRMPALTYCRIALGTLLPRSLDKILWLDADMLVRADLGRLWDEALGDRALLAVQDMVVPFVSSRYGISAYADLNLPWDAKYFNAGVMLVNLAKWRAEGVGEKASAYLRSRGTQVFLWDQEGLNAVLSKDWGALDPRWNQIAGVAGRSFYRPAHLDEDSHRRVVEDPWIVHYSGFWKPWVFENASALRASFFEALDATDWAGWRPAPSLRARALGYYESTLRDYFYPVESVYMRLAHRLARAR